VVSVFFVNAKIELKWLKFWRRSRSAGAAAGPALTRRVRRVALHLLLNMVVRPRDSRRAEFINFTVCPITSSFFYLEKVNYLLKIEIILLI
jgi:hypothetical protein